MQGETLSIIPEQKEDINGKNGQSSNKVCSSVNKVVSMSIFYS